MNKILLIEDDAPTAMIESAILEKVGFEVVVHGEGVNAYERFVQEEPNIVILDLVLPKISGVEIAVQILSDEKRNHIPILACTSNADKDDELFRKYVEVYKSFKKEEPYIFNKIQTFHEKGSELPDILATLLKQKGKPIPALLLERIKK